MKPIPLSPATILHQTGVAGARLARGITVVIDVFRAFSCAPLLSHFHAATIILEPDIDRALELRRRDPHAILVGEDRGHPLPGADLGNSPSEIILRGQPYFEDHTVILRSTAGVAAVAAAFEVADEVLLGSFVTAGATARYLEHRPPGPITLLASGLHADAAAPEDQHCAAYLEHLLTHQPFDLVAALRQITFQPTAQRFIQGSKDYLPREDPIFCLQRDLFDFVLKVIRREGHLEAVRIEPPPREVCG